MSLRDRIQHDTTAAMRSGDALRRDVLRMALNAIYQGEKRDRREYSEAELEAVVAREVKTRRESVEAFRKGGREDLATKEEAEIAILAEYLPEPLSEAEVRAIVEAAIVETGASSPRDMGRVMGVVTARTKGRADGRVVSGMVQAALADAAGAAAATGGGRSPGA